MLSYACMIFSRDCCSVMLAQCTQSQIIDEFSSRWYIKFDVRRWPTAARFISIIHSSSRSDTAAAWGCNITIDQMKSDINIWNLSGSLDPNNTIYLLQINELWKSQQEIRLNVFVLIIYISCQFHWGIIKGITRSFFYVSDLRDNRPEGFCCMTLSI